MQHRVESCITQRLTPAAAGAKLSPPSEHFACEAVSPKVNRPRAPLPVGRADYLSPGLICHKRCTTLPRAPDPCRGTFLVGAAGPHRHDLPL